MSRWNAVRARCDPRPFARWCGDNPRGVAVIVLALALAATLALAIAPRSRSYVIEATTQYMRVSGLGTANPLSLAGFSACVLDDQLASMFANGAGDCRAIALPGEPLLELACDTEMVVRRIARGPLEVQFLAGETCPGAAQAALPDESRHLRILDVATGAVTHSGTDTLILTGPADRDFAFGFQGLAVIGQPARAGAVGTLLGGKATLFNAGRFGSARYEVDTLDLVLGDVVSAEGAPSSMRGLVRTSATIADGFAVVYVGAPDGVSIDRQQTRFELNVPWTVLLTKDTWTAVAVIVVTILASIAAIMGMLPRRRRRRQMVP